MFNSKFRLCLVVVTLLVFAGIGFYVYRGHVEFQGFMSEHSRKMAELEADVQLVPATHGNSTTDQHSHVSNKDPVKVGYARTSPPDEEGGTTIIHDPPIPIPKSRLIEQEVETPDGQVHTILWHRKLRPGDVIPPLDKLPMDKVIVNGLMFNIPPGETADSYIEKINLATMYDVPLNAVDELIEEGIIAGSLEEAKDDPLFDDPLFVKREHSFPTEASAPWDPAEWGYSDLEVKAMTEGIPVSRTAPRMIDGEMMLVDTETGYVLGAYDEEDAALFAGETETVADVETPVVKPEDPEPVERIEPTAIPYDAIQEVEIAEIEQKAVTDDAPDVLQQLDNRIRRLQEIRELEKNPYPLEQIKPVGPNLW